MSPSSVPRLPLELVLSCIEAACDDALPDASLVLLSACSLVCTAWSPAVQKLLFTSVTLRSQASFDSFVNAVDRSTPHGQTLSDAVRHLRVVLDHKQPSGLHQLSFAFAVTMCPYLNKLDISLYGSAEPGNDVVGVPDLSRLRRAAPSFDEHTLSLLKSGPSISTLVFNNWSENQEAIFQLLDIWPSLRRLSIGGTTPKPLESSPLPFPCPLEELSLNFQTTPSVDFMKWLLHNSTDSLQSLHFNRDPCVETFAHLVESFGATLRSLSLPGFATPEYAALIQKCAGLQDLQTENPLLSSSFFKQLPSTLERVGLGLDHGTPLASIVEFVKMHRSLKVLRVQVRESGAKHPLFSALRIACAYSGAQLVMTRDVQLFRAAFIS